MITLFSSSPLDLGHSANILFKPSRVYLSGCSQPQPSVFAEPHILTLLHKALIWVHLTLPLFFFAISATSGLSVLTSNFEQRKHTHLSIFNICGITDVVYKRFFAVPFVSKEKREKFLEEVKRTAFKI